MFIRISLKLLIRNLASRHWRTRAVHAFPRDEALIIHQMIVTLLYHMVRLLILGLLSLNFKTYPHVLFPAKPRSSARSSSTTRVSSTTLSRKNSFEKSALISNFRENFIDKLNHSLVAKQQNAEIAKAAASNALQRKQSVPDLNELNNPNLKSQNRVTFSSSLNLNAPSQSGFQVVQIQTNPTQQPIYASRNQLRREIQELYGTLGTGIYGSLPSDSSYTNGFFNKVCISDVPLFSNSNIHFTLQL